MHLRVKLPLGPLIEYWTFCKAISEAVCPTGENGLEGIDCVTAKIVTRHVPIPESDGMGFGPFQNSWQSVLISEDGRTLNELLPSDRSPPFFNEALDLSLADASPKQVGELTLPFQLSEVDRREFAKVLKNLPPLRYPMSDEEIAAFMVEYFKLPDRPMWVPDLVTEATIIRRKSEQAAVLTLHQHALQQELEAGRLTPVSADHAPVATLMAGTFIPRTQASAYLDRHGFEYGGPELSESSSDAIEVGAEQQSAQASKGWRPGERKLSPEQVQELVNHYKALKESGERAFVKLTAEKFDVSRKHVFEVVKSASEESTEIRIDHLLVGKSQQC
ncbi:MAG: hypothetical protein WDN30_08100 [Pararobbsia sp.]